MYRHAYLGTDTAQYAAEQPWRGRKVKVKLQLPRTQPHLTEPLW